MGLWSGQYGHFFLQGTRQPLIAQRIPAAYLATSLYKRFRAAAVDAAAGVRGLDKWRDCGDDPRASKCLVSFLAGRILVMHTSTSRPAGRPFRTAALSVKAGA